MRWHPDPKNIVVKSQDTVDWPNLGFTPPAIATPQSVRRDRLYLSIGRNLALASARPRVVRALQQNARRTLDIFIDQTTADLRATTDIADLADQSLVGFAHDMAVGIAGLCMEDAGFIWRDHAKQLLPASKRRPDYVWSTDHPGGGVVLSEVKGMATSTKPFGTLRRRTEKAFTEQVDDWRLDTLNTGEPIVGGYAIGVHLPAARQAGIAVRRSQPVLVTIGSGRPRAAQPSPTLAVARGHYRAVLTLIEAAGAAAHLLTTPPYAFDAEPIAFDVVEIDGLWFATVPRRSKPDVVNRWALGTAIPALEIGALEFALRLVSGDIGLAASPDGVSHLEPPIINDELWRADHEARGSLLRALAPDGLALIGPYWKGDFKRAYWTPWDGFDME